MNKIKFDLNDRTAVITGGAQGFGLDIAKRFLDSGAKVIIWDIDPKLIDEASKEINNPNLSLSIVDISDYKAVNTAVTNILENSKMTKWKSHMKPRRRPLHIYHRLWLVVRKPSKAQETSNSRQTSDRGEAQTPQKCKIEK